MAGRREVEHTVADLEGLIAAHKQTIRVTRTNLDDPSFVQRQIDHCKRVIADHQRQLEQLEHSLTHGEEIIAEAQSAIKKLRKRVVAAKNNEQIAKLLRLQREINALRDGEDAYNG